MSDDTGRLIQELDKAKATLPKLTNKELLEQAAPLVRLTEAELLELQYKLRESIIHHQ